MRKAFFLYSDWKPLIDALSETDAGRLIKAIYAYQDGEPVELPGALGAIFAQFKAVLDADAKRYAETCEKRRAAGQKGAESKSKQLLTNASNCTHKNKNKNKNIISLNSFNNFPQREYDPSIEYQLLRKG